MPAAPSPLQHVDVERVEGVEGLVAERAGDLQARRPPFGASGLT